MNDVMRNALEVHEVLTRYIKIHNDIFEGSVRRIIPIPGIFQSIDYRKHHDNLFGLTQDLETIISKTLGNSEFACALSMIALMEPVRDRRNRTT